MRPIIAIFRQLVALLPWRRRRSRKRTVTLLFTIIAAAFSLSLFAQTGSAQTPPAEAPSQIQDNSFLIEEAYNQDPGVVQHIQTFARATRGDGWVTRSPRNGRRRTSNTSSATPWRRPRSTASAASATSPSTTAISSLVMPMRAWPSPRV
jgi:hypothetical protein